MNFDTHFLIGYLIKTSYNTLPEFRRLHLVATTKTRAPSFQGGPNGSEKTGNRPAHGQRTRRCPDPMRLIVFRDEFKPRGRPRCYDAEGATGGHRSQGTPPLRKRAPPQRTPRRQRAPPRLRSRSSATIRPGSRLRTRLAKGRSPTSSSRIVRSCGPAKSSIVLEP